MIIQPGIHPLVNINAPGSVVRDGGSFHDRGNQYTSAIFYHNEAQRDAATESKKALEESGVFDKAIVSATSFAGSSLLTP